MQSLDTLNLIPVWVNSDHLASTARIILAGHRLKVLGVLEGGDLVGVVTAAQLKHAPDDAKIRDLMEPPHWIVEASTPLRQLAETFWEEDLDYLPVVQDQKFRGIVTPNMLLKEMARSWDPLTGLSWSDRLREWGAENLKQGREITIIFIDLDDFGSYNKKYGHIVGDRVLQKVADMIQAHIDPSRDQLVRYGGDEFAIGTVRAQAESLEFAESLREGMSRLRVAGSDEPVTFSVGVQGGKRTKERENVHYAATLDNLINLASKNSMAEKASKKTSEGPGTGFERTPEVGTEELTAETAQDLAESHGETSVNAPPPATLEPEIELRSIEQDLDVAHHAIVEETVTAEIAPSAPLRIADVLTDPADANSVTQVLIEAGTRSYTGVCPRKGGSVLKSISIATANAITQIHPEVRLEIKEVFMTESENGVRFVSVLGAVLVGGEHHPMGGVAPVGLSLSNTVAEATLQAFTNFESQRVSA